MRKGDFEFRTPLHAYIPPLALSWCRVMTGKVDARRHERQKPTPDTEARRSRTNPGPGRGRNTIPPRPLLCRGNSMSSSLYRSVLTRRSVPCMYLHIRHAASHWRTRPEVHRRRRFTSLYVRVWVYASLEGDSSDGMRRKTPSQPLENCFSTACLRKFSVCLARGGHLRARDFVEFPSSSG